MKRNLWIHMFSIIALALIFLAGCKSDTNSMISNGNSDFEKGNAKSATEKYIDVIKNEPTNIIAHIKLASAGAYINCDYKAFYRRVKFLEQLNPEFKNIYDMFEMVENAGDIDKLLFFVKTMNQKYFENKEDNKFVKDEIAAVSEAINNNPGNPYFYFVRGLWNSYFVNISEAVDDFTKALDIKKDFWQAAYLRGRLYTNENLWQLNDNSFISKLKAINDFNRVAYINPSYTEVLYAQALLYQQMGNKNESLNCINKLYKSDSTNIPALMQKAALESQTGDNNGAIADYTRLVQKFPENAEFMYLLGAAKIAGGKKAEGIADLKKALAFCKSKKVENNIMSVLNYNVDKKTETIIPEKKSNPDQFVKLYLEGQEKIKNGKRAEGIELLKKADAICTNNYYKRKISQIIKSETKKLSRSENEVKNRTKDNLIFKKYYSLGREKIADGKTNEGINYLKRAIRICKNDGEKDKIQKLIIQASALKTVNKKAKPDSLKTKR